ncbi:acyl-CoA dehydrogenase family protein [Halomicrococcus sp. NG-SE-24]|uniref:acyl-CoA dehydrogenase family protein n=1 Tax=Halomicrococcus sp. NG-SE-24 TaxID=3436928 RepID=UPI003D99A736
MDPLTEDIVPEHAREAKRQARAFANEHVAPNAERYYRTGEYPWDVVEEAREQDLIGANVGEEYGGQGLDIYELLAVGEELFRADAGIGLTLSLAAFGTDILEKYGAEWQKEEFLRPIPEGNALSGLAVSEPVSGSDLVGMETTAEKDGDEWVIDGEKYWIGNGVEADWVTLYAKTGDDEDNRYGNYSLFVVPTDAPGYEAEHVPEKMAMRASKQADVTLDDCRIPEEYLIGAEGAGFYMLADFFNKGRVVVGGHGLGLASAAIEEAWTFVQDREAFDRTISDFQAVQHDLADMRIEFESARALNWRAAEKVANDENSGLWAALAKTKSTEVATTCAKRGMQLHGGRSIFTDRRIARVFRDARIPVIYEGANEVQRNLIYGQSRF